MGTYGDVNLLPFTGCSGPCNAGRYGDRIALTTPNCTGPCPAGRYGLPGQTSVFCSGLCNAGHACVEGSGSATEYVCPAGQYSYAGAWVCTQCVAGTYSIDRARPTNCTDICPRGAYCPTGTGEPRLCPSGRYGALPALVEAACTDVCPAGTYCPAGSVAPIACPAGTCQLCSRVLTVLAVVLFVDLSCVAVGVGRGFLCERATLP